jgi:fructokinase
VLKLNDDELGQLTSPMRAGNAAPRDLRNLSGACASLAEKTGVARICVTRGAEGAALWENGGLITAPAPRVEVRDTVGAGDAFMAGLMRGLTLGMELPLVLESACRLGGFVASHHGATPLFPADLKAQFRIS